MNEILKRSITGFFFISSILLAIYIKIEYSIFIYALFLLMVLLEFYNLFQNEEKIHFSKWYLFFLSIVSFSVLSLSFIEIIDFVYVFLLLPLYLFTFFFALWNKSEAPIYSISIYFIALFYLTIPFSLLVYLTIETNWDNHLLTGMFFMIWANDTFAYLGGLAFGKNKLFEKISPKKTWEGALSGFLFVLIFAGIWGFFIDKENSLAFWLIAALIVSPTAILGDLFESLIKRSFHVKDSGNILPGHGGVLDRFDASLLVIPFFFTWYLIYSSI
ncbi:MAG: phosphatidate cytidylyltransferase [Flavobacteriia bacterium]|nr:phosphatidate cytidylyltransferase [Flavobacteriia bacterium]